MGRNLMGVKNMQCIICGNERQFGVMYVNKLVCNECLDNIDKIRDGDFIEEQSAM